MGLILRSSSLANPGDSVTVKGSTLDWVEGDGNFVYLLNKINSGGGGSPAGSDTQIQYNNAGAFGADSGLTFNQTTNTFTATNDWEVYRSEIEFSDGGVLDDLSASSATSFTGTPPTIFYVTAFGNIQIVNYTNLVGGNFDQGDIITGSISGAQGTVAYDDGSGQLYVSITNSIQFATGDVIDNGNGVTADYDTSTTSDDIFFWFSSNGGTGGPTVITGSSQALNDGISITFGSTTGHGAGDSWYWSYKTLKNTLLTNRIVGTGELSGAINGQYFKSGSGSSIIQSMSGFFQKENDDRIFPLSYYEDLTGSNSNKERAYYGLNPKNDPADPLTFTVYTRKGIGGFGSNDVSQFSVSSSNGIRMESDKIVYIDSPLFNATEQLFSWTGNTNSTGITIDDSNSLITANGLKNTIPGHTTTPVFTGSGLDNILVNGSGYSGTGTTNYVVSIDGINKDYVSFPTSSISGSGFQVGETITSTSGGSATIDAVNVNSSGSYEILILSSITGTFLQFDTITGGTSGTTATIDSDLGQQDTYTWTDGTTTVSNVICKTPGSILISNNVLVNFYTGTGHTLSDSWTFDGVPGTTNYGGMLYLNGLSKKISLGDVDGITGSNRAFLTLDSSNGTSGIISKIFRLRTTSGNTFLDADSANGSYIFGANGFGNNNLLNIDDNKQNITAQTSGNFILQNPATTVFMRIDTVNETAKFGGQSWRSGLYADNSAGTTTIGDWNADYNETRIIVNDLEKTNTLVGGFVTPVIQGVDYGDTVTAGNGVASIMIGSAGTGTTTINLDGTYAVGQELQIFDRGYGAGSNNIVVDAQTGNVIIQKGTSPAQTYTIATNGESIVIKKVSSTEWMIIAKN